MKKSKITDFPVVTHINLVTRTESGTITAAKAISIDEFNCMSGQEPIEWREDVILNPDYQDKLPDLSIYQFPPKGRAYLAKIQEAVAKTIPHLALIYANDAFEYSTITTKRFAAGELCLIYAGQYFPMQYKADVYTLEVVDRNENPFGTIDAKRYRGFGGFMASVPSQKKEHPNIPCLEDYDFFSVDQKKLAHTNVCRMKNFSFNNIPYVVFTNPRPIEPFTLLTSSYGAMYFRKHDIIPLLSYADGLLVDTSLYTSKNIEFDFVQGEGSVVCHVARSAVSTLLALNQVLKFDITENMTYFVSREKLQALLIKYPPHSPFIRIEEDDYIIVNPALLSSSLA